MSYKLAILIVFGLITSSICDVNCPSFTSCQECYAQNTGGVEVCGWCASDANGGGSCIHATNTQQPVTPCPSGYWNYDCCSQHTSCDDCSTSNAHCKWCESGSSVNGNKCIPYNNILAPQLGGCDTKYYTNNCCGDYTTCDACSESNKACKWCQKGSSVNGGSCIPYDNNLDPMWGGCDSGYFTNNCCDDYGTCDTCSKSGKACKWCQTGSNVNGGSCLPFDNSLNPMWGGCEAGYYTNNCCDDYTTCDECSTSNKACKWCQKGSAVNGNRCVPFDNDLNPMWGGCDADYYTNSCCQDMQSCTECIAKGWRCKWCGDGSTVNPSECLPFNNDLDPMYGGCDKGNFTSTCPADFISF